MLYLEDYIELIEHMPIDLKDRFTDIREMDLQVQNTVDDLSGKLRTLFHACLVKKGRVENADEVFQNIRASYHKALDDADKKVQLAGQLYDLVDRHLRKLDQELAKFKMELEADNGGITEVLERRSLELDNAVAHLGHSLHSNYASSAVDSPHNLFSVTTGTMNDQPEKRRKIDNISDTWDCVEYVPPSIHSPDLPKSLSGIGLDRNGSRPQSRNSINGPLQGDGSGDFSHVPGLHELMHVHPVKHGYLVKSNQDSVNSQDVAFKPESTLEDIVAVVGSHKSTLSENSIDEESHRDMLISSPSLQGSRPSRTKKQTSKAAAWNQERMQAEARRGHTRDREHHTVPHPNSSAVELVERSTLAVEWNCDPHEPRYCLCNQVSYGEMVGCDNAKCAVEWFHYGCVGLMEAPKGKWYCPQCTQSMKRRNKCR